MTETSSDKHIPVALPGCLCSWSERRNTMRGGGGVKAAGVEKQAVQLEKKKECGIGGV